MSEEESKAAAAAARTIFRTFSRRVDRCAEDLKKNDELRFLWHAIHLQEFARDFAEHLKRTNSPRIIEKGE